ncbi:ECF transporter S component [Candidatus Bathyarchaeota archaeon]|nr:ECF transporter S component [Candidatus Bathyarchaeota archaeon]
MKRKKSIQIAASGVMAALVCAATMLIQVPIPATEGFFNIGDVMIMVAALTFGPLVGAIAGGIGSSLADLLGGWYIYVVPTLIIKGIEGLLVGWICEKNNQSIQRAILAWIVGGLEMVAGYFIFQVFILRYGVVAALVEAPFNIVQMVVGGIIGIPLSLALKRRIQLQ